MTQHYLLSKEVRDFSLHHVASLDAEAIFRLISEIKFGSSTEYPCPSCGVIDIPYYIRTRKQWRCRECQRSFSLFSGTALADCKLPLKKLVLAIYLYSSASKGLSASQLSRWIDVNYKTAFTILHKLRESITRSADKSPVSGTIHIDGGHFGGKPRSGQFRNKAKPEAIAEKIKLGKSQGARRSRMSRANYERRKRNRRIVMVIRQLGEMGKGALRTIVEVAHGETEKVVKSLTERYVTPGSLIQTDESPAYHSCCLRYRHEAVQHSTEYSTIDGVNNNQAESYFSRLRRFEYGVSHRMEAKYMRDYASEMAWREDFRRKSEFNRFKDIVERIMLNGLSRWWCGYWQGVKRESEMLWEA